MPFPCTKCSASTAVIQTLGVSRRRRCVRCDHSFYTLESIVLDTPTSGSSTGLPAGEVDEESAAIDAAFAGLPE